MDRENPLPLWLRQVLIGIGLFLAGAVLAFGYSYRPLHGAMSWEIEQLQTRLDERNRENLQLSDALARQKSNEATRIDPDTLAQVERELDQTKRVLRKTEKDLKRAESKRKESDVSAAKWRKRYEEIRDAETPKIAETPPPPEPAPTETSAFEIAPAAPAPNDGQSPDAQERGMLPGDDALGSDPPASP